MSASIWSPSTLPSSIRSQSVATLRQFGVVGDGSTVESLDLIHQALQSGQIIDGQGLTYIVDGTVKPSSLVGLQNAKFNQVKSKATVNVDTLDFRDLSNYFLHNVKVHMGDEITTLFSDDGNNGIRLGGSQTDAGAASVTTYAENIWVSKVEITGNGCGAGLHIRHAKNFVVDSPTVRDRISGATPDPTNDSQNGIQFNNCESFALFGHQVRNLKTRLSGTPTVKWTRGILFAECRKFSVGVGTVREVDQGYDLSGAVIDGTSPSTYQGNREFSLSGAVASLCNTWGFKFANVTHDGTISACVADYCGLAGFVVSTQDTAFALANDSYRTQNLDFIGCKSINVLGTSWASPGASYGFRVFGISGHGYPRGIRFKQCNTTDNQNTPTTQWGFFSDADLIRYPSVGYNKNSASYLESCDSLGVTSGHSSGIGTNFCQISGTGTFSIATSGTFTAVDWNTDIVDATGLHNLASNNNTIYIKVPGEYRLEVSISFAANATGNRQVRFLKNGGVINRSTGVSIPSAAVACVVTSFISVSLVPGDRISIEAYQNSGGALNIDRAESYLSVSKSN